MENFEKASKLKLRFITSKGALSTEELWDLSLQSLDTVAKLVSKQLRETSEESFIGVKSPDNAALSLKLDILKHIIAVKLEEKDVAAKRVEKQAKIATIKNLIAEKELDSLGNKSAEDLQKMLNELE